MKSYSFYNKLKLIKKFQLKNLILHKKISTIYKNLKKVLHNHHLPDN